MVYVSMLTKSDRVDSQFLTNFKSRDLINLSCVVCDKPFTRAKNELQKSLKRKKGIYCSYSCVTYSRMSLAGFGSSDVVCKHCGKAFVKQNSDIKKSPNNFCSKSCSATYKNKHKTTGYRRSKLEKYLEERIRQEFPDLEFETNCRSVIDYELDFYFPSLKLAVEVNGPIHYKPIYSQDKFERIQEIDREKVRMCEELGIQLVIIPNLNDFKVQLGYEYFNLLVAGGGFEPPIF